MKRKQYVVIGLGRFGTSVAKTLFNSGNEVVAVDSDSERVQSISESVTYAAQLDASDEASLKSIGVGNFDVAVIAIGSDVQSSIMAALIVRELGISYVIAKANDDMHAKVLYKVGVNKVIMPERDMGLRVAHSLESSNFLDYIELSPEYSLAEIKSPEEWNNKSLKELDMRSKYGINVVAIRNDNHIDVTPGADTVIKESSIIVAIGSCEALNNLEGLLIK